MNEQDSGIRRLWTRRAERLVPALDALMVAAILLALRPILQVEVGGSATRDLLHDPFLMTWAFVGGLLGLVFLTWSQRAGHYDRRRPRRREVSDLVGWVLLLGMIDVAMSAFGRVGTAAPVAAWLLIALLVPALRLATRRYLAAQGLWRRPVVVVGVGANAERAAAALMGDESLGLTVIAFADPAEGRVLAGGGIRPVPRMVEVLGRQRPVLPLERLLAGGDREGHSVHVVIAPDRAELPACARLAERLAAAGHDVCFMPPAGAAAGLERLNHPGGVPARVSEALGRVRARAFDVLGGAAICLCAAPLLLGIALAILTVDGRPVLCSRERTGADGRRFAALGFRTMRPDAQARLQALLESDPAARAEWQRHRELMRDPRFSRLGRWLRRTSLDELPRLLNVIRGDVGLLGAGPAGENLDRHVPRVGRQRSWPAPVPRAPTPPMGARCERRAGTMPESARGACFR